MSATTLRSHIAELIKRHGSYRAAAAVTKIESTYLYRLGAGDKTEPSKETLRKLGLRREVTYWSKP